MMDKINAEIRPEGTLEILSRLEVAKLLDTSQGGLHHLFRNCSLAVLNCGSTVDDSKKVLEQHQDFDIRVFPQQRGVRLELSNAPATAFVDGEMIRGIREHLFAVLRDIVYTSSEIVENPAFDLTRPGDITNALFHILRNAGLLHSGAEPKLVVCWGGHSISREEYDYSKEVGHELGLRGLNVCTGCGPGAMKGPMKGAAIGHAKQRIHDGLYVGISEPGIIAAEPPNPIVNRLVIMPDIEKRLEAFVRLGHGIVVFPGGVGTMEELLHILGILLHPANRTQPCPLILTGPASCRGYLEMIDGFITDTLGIEVRNRYQVIVDDPAAVAREIKDGLAEVRQFRQRHHAAYYFNWEIHVEPEFQTPFVPTHASMAAVELGGGQAPHRLAANLRRAFSGIVAGNVKADGIRAIEEQGPFELHGEPGLVQHLDRLLSAFVDQGRMKLPGARYEPCYRLVA